MIGFGVTIHDVPKFKRGPIEVYDETAISNPNSFDYDFSENSAKAVDYEDLYDQFIQQLPRFHLYKLGQDRGVTQLPLVTPGGNTWFTKAKDDNQRTTPYPYSKLGKLKQSNSQESEEHTTRRASTTTTEAPTTTTPVPTTTTKEIITEKPRARQPPPAFVTSIQKKIIRPIWRHGEVIFPETTTTRPTTREVTRLSFQRQTTTTTSQPSTPRQRTVMGIRVTTESPMRSTTRWIFFRRTSTTTTTERPTTQFFRRAEQRISSETLTTAQPKPIVIHSPGSRYSGPTFNCRVLNPFNDGVPSSEHDATCRMSYPGYSLDGSCRCYYKVAGRDEHGCATGFLYACRQLSDTSVRV